MPLDAGSLATRQSDYARDSWRETTNVFLRLPNPDIVLYVMPHPNGQMLPKEIHYTTDFLATRYINGQTKPPQTSSLLEALKQEAFITPLDGIFFLGCKRIASDIARLRKQNPELNIVMKRAEVSDSFTGTTRKMACYSLK